MAFLVALPFLTPARSVQAGCALMAHAPTTPRTNVTHSGYHVGHPNHPFLPARASRISVRASLHSVNTNFHVIKCNHFCEPPPASPPLEQRKTHAMWLTQCGSVRLSRRGRLPYFIPHIVPFGYPSSLQMWESTTSLAFAVSFPSSSVFRLLKAAPSALRCSRSAPQPRRSLVTR